MLSLQVFLFGLLPHEKIRIEIDINIDTYSSSTTFGWEYGTIEVEPNEQGQSMVTGYEKLEDTFRKLDDISKGFGSPLYWGEFCVMDQYINDYTNYKEYTDAFVELTDKYNLNWIWHRMSEYPSDNGYGAYLGSEETDVVPYESNKRKSMWEYIIPKILKYK